MKCERCGRNVPIRSKVCPNCGKENPNYEPRPETETTSGRPVTPHVSTGGTTASAQASHTSAQAASSVESKPANSGKKSTLKTVLILAVVVIAAIFLFKQCGALQLRGTWEASDGSSITFSDSKNGYITAGRNSINFTYFVDGDELEIKTADSIYSYSKVVRYKFNVSGDKLTLTDVEYGSTEVFYKK